MILHEEQLPRFIIWEISVPTVGSRAIAQTTGVRIALLFRTKKKMFQSFAVLHSLASKSMPWLEAIRMTPVPGVFCPQLIQILNEHRKMGSFHDFQGDVSCNC